MFSVLVIRLRSLRLLRVSGIVMRLRMFLLLITFLKASHSFRNRLLVICKNAYLFATMIMTSVSSPFSCCSGIVSLTIPLQQLNGLETLVIIMVANKYAFLQITRRRFLNEWEAFKKVISRRNIRRRITIPLTLSNLKLLRRITRTENILHRNFTRRQVAIQNRVASNIGISQSTFSVKVLNLFSRSRRKTNKRKSKHSAMLRNKETRHRMFIGLLNTTRKLA